VKRQRNRRIKDPSVVSNYKDPNGEDIGSKNELITGTALWLSGILHGVRAPDATEDSTSVMAPVRATFHPSFRNFVATIIPIRTREHQKAVFFFKL